MYVHGKSWYQCLVSLSLSLRNQNYRWNVSECVDMSICDRDGRTDGTGHGTKNVFPLSPLSVTPLSTKSQFFFCGNLIKEEKKPTG
jgi:hypothetical protein